MNPRHERTSRLRLIIQLLGRAQTIDHQTDSYSGEDFFQTLSDPLLLEVSSEVVVVTAQLATGKTSGIRSRRSAAVEPVRDLTNDDSTLLPGLTWITLSDAPDTIHAGLRISKTADELKTDQVKADLVAVFGRTL